VAEAERLRRANPKTGERLSYQKISTALAALGHLNERGRPFNPKSVMSMVEHDDRTGRAKRSATAVAFDP
jgi:hypothetical protein